MNTVRIKDRLGDVGDGLTAIEALVIAHETGDIVEPITNSTAFIVRTLRDALQEITAEIDAQGTTQQ